MQNADKFAAETLENGVSVYRATVKADRGRQKQELISANFKGRFVLATSEKLLMQTLNNISGKSSKNRLSDEPLLAAFNEKTAPHAATVWVNQTALNDDYYFRRYWLMGDAENLKNIRAGVFDFEMQTGKFVERRKFLLGETGGDAPFEISESNNTLAFLPENVPFYQLKKANAKTLGEAFEKTVADRRANAKTADQRSFYDNSYAYSDDYADGDYYSLSEKFDETIDDVEETETFERKERRIDFAGAFESAEPQTVLTFTTPRILPAPLFLKFRRAAVIRFAAPEKFNRAAFEAAIRQRIAEQVLIAAPNEKLIWETNGESDFSYRALHLPMLGWQISYAVRGDDLILTNDVEFLREAAANAETRTVEKPEKPLNELTVVKLDQRENAFDRVFEDLAAKNAADDFFTGNVASLLGALSDVRKIEIRKNYSQNFLDEEVIVYIR